MAARTDASGDSLSRTANLPPIASYTLMGRFRIVVDEGASGNLFAIGESTGGNYHAVWIDAARTIAVYNGLNFPTGTAVLQVGRPYHIALTCDGTTLRTYVDGVADVTTTYIARTLQALFINNSGDIQWVNASVDDVRIYNAPLTAREIVAEMNSPVPVRRRDLNAHYPMKPGPQRRLDVTGLGRHLTQNGTITDYAGAPLLQQPSRRTFVIPPASGDSITGTASLTEAADTLSAAGTLALAGAASLTEAADTSTATGTLSLTGTASLTEAADTLTSAGTVALVGSASLTEASDTVSAAGVLALAGTLAATEAADTLTAAGTLPIAGAASLTEAADTLSAAGALPLVASASLTEADDTLTATGSGAANTGSLSATEAADTLTAAGTLALVGSLSATEAADTLTAAGSGSANTGTLNTTEADDTLVSTGALALSALLVTAEGPDTLTATGVLPIAGAASLTEAADTLSALAGVAIIAVLSVLEANDTLTATGVEVETLPSPRALTFASRTTDMTFAARGALTFEERS